MSRLKIIVTGSNGQLGSELKELQSIYTSYDFVFFSREDFPINDEKVVKEIFEHHRPAYLINCAAYTAVDKAETEMDQATEINGIAVGNLALQCRLFGTKFIHISTDYVFNGLAQKPLKETDPVDPVNFYGSTKLMGETLALQHYPETMIIRTSWVYSFYGKNFVKTMIRLMSEKESMGVVNDQRGAPTYAADLAKAIMDIISSGKWVPGIYHYSNEGNITWYEFAAEIRNMIDAPCKVSPISTEQFPTPAKRPAYSVMDTSKIRETFGLKIPNWKESLSICIHKLSQ